jgi:soluble lytic murein transglycosylase
VSRVTRIGRVCLAGVSLLLGCAVVAASAAAEDPLAAARQLFVREYAAVESGAPLSSAADAATLRTYVLYPYLQRARIARALGKTVGPLGPVDVEAREFLVAHHGEPVAPELRLAWLRSLAARGHWTAFAEHYQAGLTDAALRCQWLNARIATGGDATLRAAVTEQWLTPERLPPECERSFAWLRADNGMTEELIEQRVRLLLDNGQTAFARIVAGRLPAGRAAPLLQWADLLDHPERSIDAVLAGSALAARGDDTALLAAWRKLARSNPRAALERYTRLRRLFDHDDVRLRPYALALALGLAWDRHAAEALRLFRSVTAPGLDDASLAWQARAALWVGDWRQVERSIESMSANQQLEPRWRYWAARAAAARGNSAAAQTLYSALLESDNFYSASAAARLGQNATPHPEELGADEAAIAALAAEPALVRARELLLAGLRGPAFGEWQSAVGALDDGQRSQAVHLAARWQWHDVSVATATRQRVFFDYALLYPRPYDTEVRAAAALAELEWPLLYAIVRQESLFRADAVSSAGAVGLAQVRPETARIVARNWRRPTPKPADLLDPGVNLALGAAHLRELFDEFDGQTAVALAGYNAGPRAAERWLPGAPIDADIWIENIPYNETRDYVQRVLWHRVVFGWLETGAGEEFARWLAPIRPVVPRAAPASASTAAAG